MVLTPERRAEIAAASGAPLTHSPVRAKARGPSPSQLFWLFSAIHLALWTLLPAIWQGNGPLDVIEALAWGKEWQWGYSKHPPLAPWLTELAGGFPHLGIWPVYLLGQVAMVVCFWAVWRLAREFVDPARALLAPVVLEGISYYNLFSPEFNPNTLQLPLWALTILCFWLALRRRRLLLWLGFGACAGLAMLTKYYSALLLLSMATLLLCSREGRCHLRTPGPYLAAAVALLIFSPHLVWAATHHFATVSYGLARVGGEHRALSRVLYPLAFTTRQAAEVAPAALLLLPLLPFPLRPRWPKGFEGRFLLAMGLGPFLLTLAASLLFGWQIHAMWGTPLWSLTGLMAIVLVRPTFSPTRSRWFGALLVAVLALPVLVFADTRAARPVLLERDWRALFPGEQLSAAITRGWHAAVGRRLEYVVGEYWPAGNVAYYSPDRPSTFIRGDRQFSAWIDEARLRERGAALVWETSAAGLRSRNRLLAKFPSARVQPPLALPWRNGTPLPPVQVGWAILYPER